jgi:Na+-driven multidrug efflux pump
MNIPKLFGKILIPTLLGMLFSATLVIAEGIFVGKGVGSDGLAAVNILCPLFMITTGIGLMFGVGASIVASIHLSQEKVKAARINITQALLMGSILMVLLSALVMCFHKEVAYLFGSTDRLLPLVLGYMDWLTPFLVFQMIMSMGLFLIRLDGSPVYAMLCNAIPAVINILFCYIFVIRLNWGMKGAGMAYSIGIAIGGLMTIIYILFFSSTLHLYKLKISRKSMNLSIRNIGYMVKLGSSAILGELAIACMMLVGNYVFIDALGEDGVAAFGVACYCFPLCFLVNNAISQSAQPIISYNYGTGNRKRVNKTVRLSIVAALLCGFAATVATIFFCEPLVGLFLKKGCNAYEIAIQGLPYFALGYVFFAFNIACVGYYQSVEKARQATVYTFLRGFAFMLVCFLTLPWLLGNIGIWLSVPCSEILTALVIAGYFICKKKETPQNVVS